MALFLLIIVVLMRFGQSLPSGSNEVIVNKTNADKEPPRTCNRTVLQAELRTCEHDMINALLTDYSTNCSTESARLDNCIKNLLVDCFTLFVEKNLSRLETLEEAIDASVKQFKFGQYYCSPAELNQDWQSVPPKLRDAMPCEKILFQKVAECGEIFRYVFSGNRSDSRLCGLYTNAKKCTRFVYKKYCTVSVPAFDTYNPFCPSSKDFVESEIHGVWTRVTRSWIQSIHKSGVEVSYNNDKNGLTIRARVTSGGCESRPGSALLVYIKKKWKYIIYTQEFKGSASCWRIFGNRRHNRFYDRKLSETPHGLINFDPKQGDLIWNQQNMGGVAGDQFRGSTYRCDDESDNFWHERNGQGLRRATVKLRRDYDAPYAGIYTATNCGNPFFVIKDIFVYM